MCVCNGTCVRAYSDTCVCEAVVFIVVLVCVFVVAPVYMCGSCDCGGTCVYEATVLADFEKTTVPSFKLLWLHKTL